MMLVVMVLMVVQILVLLMGAHMASLILQDTLMKAQMFLAIKEAAGAWLI